MKLLNLLLVTGLCGFCPAQNQGADADTPPPKTSDSKESAPNAKALELHKSVLTIDTHKDISPLMAPDKYPSDPVKRERIRAELDPSVRGTQQVDFPKMREGGLDCAYFIVYVGQKKLTPAGFAKAKAEAFAKFDAIDRMVRQFPEQIELGRTAADVERIAAAGKLVACIGIENGYAMGEDLALLQEFFERGARYMSLAHNGHTQLGDSHTPAEPLHGGLSELGRKAIAELNRLGIMVDVSHASKQTMLDAVAASKAPVMASHSGVRAINDHSRNLDDEQLDALKKNGGVIQCVALASFVKDAAERRAAIKALREKHDLSDQPKDDAPPPTESLDSRMARFADGMVAINEQLPRANVSDFVDHIDYAVKRIGIDHVAIASDFDGGGGIDGWNDASETANVTLELVRRGYSAADIEKIWSVNTLRVMREVEAAARETGSGNK